MVEWNLLHKFSHLLCLILIEVDVALTRSSVVDTCHLVKPQFNLCNSISATIFIQNFILSGPWAQVKAFVKEYFWGNFNPQNIVLFDPFGPQTCNF